MLTLGSSYITVIMIFTTLGGETKMAHFDLAAYLTEFKFMVRLLMFQT